MEFEMTAERKWYIEDYVEVYWWHNKYTILKLKCGQRQKNAYSYHYLCYAMLYQIKSTYQDKRCHFETRGPCNNEFNHCVTG